MDEVGILVVYLEDVEHHLPTYNIDTYFAIKFVIHSLKCGHLERSSSIPTSFVTVLPVVSLLYLYFPFPSIALMMRLLGAVVGPLSMSSGLPAFCKSLLS